MDEAVESATFTEVLPEGVSGDPDDMNVNLGAHTYSNVNTMD